MYGHSRAELRLVFKEVFNKGLTDIGIDIGRLLISLAKRSKTYKLRYWEGIDL